METKEYQQVTGKEITVYSYNGISLSIKRKELLIYIHNMSESQNHNVSKNQSEYTVWFHKYEVLEQAKLIYHDRNQIIEIWDRELTVEIMRKAFGVMEIVSILFGAMIIGNINTHVHTSKFIKLYC